MAQARVVVTCNPSSWEGDFRLWLVSLSLSLALAHALSLVLTQARLYTLTHARSRARAHTDIRTCPRSHIKQHSQPPISPHLRAYTHTHIHAHREALGSGALVFVDRMFSPMPHPPRHRHHIIVYDPDDQAGFLRLLRYYTTDPTGLREAADIAFRGFVHALRFHRTLSRIDFMLTSFKRLGVSSEEERQRRENLFRLRGFQGNPEVTLRRELGSLYTDYDHEYDTSTPVCGEGRTITNTPDMCASKSEAM